MMICTFDLAGHAPNDTLSLEDSGTILVNLSSVPAGLQGCVENMWDYIADISAPDTQNMVCSMEQNIDFIYLCHGMEKLSSRNINLKIDIQHNV